MAANNKNRNENTKPTPKPVDAATSTIMTLYSALFFLTIVVATLGVFFVYSFRGLFDDMTFYYLAIYFFASATLLLLSSLACIFTMQAVRLGHRLHLTTRRTLQVCLGFLLLHLLYDILLLLYFGVLAMQLWDVETSTDDVGGNGEPLSVHEKVIGGLFNEMFFNLVIYCEEGPAWLWDWIDTQCVQGLHSSDCDQCEPFPGFCAADAASCLNGNHDALSLGCPYPLCRESVLKVVGTYVCVFMMAYNLIVSILHLICMVCVCSQVSAMSSQRSQNASKSRALTYQLSSLSILPPYSSLSMNFEEETSHYPYGKRVYVVGDAELYQHCEPIPLESITKPEPELLKQVQDAHSVLKNFRAKMGFGRALAAPQVGINRRFIVMKLAGGLPRTLYNPVVTAQSSDMFTMWDDCLSFPDKMCCVQRYTWISISFMDEQGERVDWEKLPQDLSELLQHEIDHLDGVLAIDKAVQPSKNASCAAVIDRAEYLACKQEFDSMVDFCY